ncbi:protein FAM3C-like [Saccoglossus kowalevskii]
MILKMCLCGRRRSSVTVIKLLALLSVFVLLYYIHGKSSTYPADQISDKIHVVEKVDNPADENVVAVAGGDEDAGAAPVKLPVPPVVSVPNNKCGITEMCRSTEKVFHLISGESQERTPTICLDGKFFIGGDNPELYAGRGMNLIVVDKEANKVLKARNFDLYMFDDGEMIAWLKSLGNGDILMVATFDDAARQLTAETREILKKDFGSTKIDDLNFRGNWVFIGQKGISGSSSYENIELFNSEVSEWALQTSIHGCLTLPVGREQHKVDGSIDESVPTSKCGFSESCPEDTIAFNVISGSHVGNQKVLPSVCIDGDM